MTAPADEREQAMTDVRTFAPRFGPISFSATLGISMGVLVLLAVTTVLAVQFWVSKTTTFEFLNKKAEDIVQQIESDIRNHLDPAVGLDLRDHAARDTGQLAQIDDGELQTLPELAHLLADSRLQTA